MKKKLFYLASILIGLTFAACSSDDGGVDAPAPTLSNSLLTHTDDAMTLENLNSIGAPFEEAVFTETGRAIIGPFTKPSEGKQRRTEDSGSTKYIVGTYVSKGAIFTVYDEDGNESGITMWIGDEIGDLAYYEYRPAGWTHAFILDDKNGVLSYGKKHTLISLIMSEFAGN